MSPGGVEHILQFLIEIVVDDRAYVLLEDGRVYACPDKQIGRVVIAQPFVVVAVAGIREGFG